MIHLLFDNEVNGNCKCGHRTILMSLSGGTTWYPDQEPYVSDELTEDIKDKAEVDFIEEMVDGVELDTELSLHYCPKCERIVEFCANIKEE